MAWQKLAEQCNEYLHKGSRVYIEGRLQTREWQAQDGQPQRTMEVIASDMIMLDSRSGSVEASEPNTAPDAEDLDF